MRYLIGVLYIPPFQFGTYVYEQMTPDQFKQWVSTGQLGTVKVPKKKDDPRLPDTFHELTAIAVDIQASLSEDERKRVLEFTGLHVNPMRPFKLTQLNVNDVVVSCRYSHVENYGTADHHEVWEVGKLTRIA